MKTQLLLPLSQAVEERSLRYAIRSWEECFGEIELLVVARELPQWLAAANFIPIHGGAKNRYQNISDALAVASKSDILAEDFVLVNDDFYCFTKWLGMTFHSGSLAELISENYGTYRRSLEATEAVLQKIGKPTRSFELHLPMVMSKKALQEAAALHEASIEPLQLRSLVGNISAEKTSLVGLSKDVKLRDSGPEFSREHGYSFLSCDDAVFYRLSPMLEERFSEPSIFELEVPFTGLSFEELGGKALSVTLPEELYAKPGLRPFNPSLAWHEGEMYVSIRYAFFEEPGVDSSGLLLSKENRSSYGVSFIVLGKLELSSLSIKDCVQLELVGAPASHANLGLEDIRLFSRSGELFGIGTFLHRDSSNHQQALVRFDFSEATPKAVFVKLFESPYNAVEKNWMPIEGTSDFIYSASQVWSDGAVSGSIYSGMLHGGTQLVKTDAGYLALVHNFISKASGLDFRKKRHYVHYWAFFNEDLQLEKLSPAFNFGWSEGNTIEFASGLVKLSDEKLLVSYGVGDADCKFAVFSTEAISDALELYDRESEAQVLKS